MHFEEAGESKVIVSLSFGIERKRDERSKALCDFVIKLVHVRKNPDDIDVPNMKLRNTCHQ